MQVIQHIKLNRFLSFSAFLSGAFLCILASLMFFPVCSQTKNSQAAPGTPTESTLSLDIAKSTASVDLTVASTSGTFAKSTSENEASFDVSTNNYTGYTLTINASDDTGNLVNGEATLSSISNSMAESSFDNSSNNGKWGYKPSYYNSSANTDFLPSPTTNASTLDVTSVANASAKTYTIALGARADYTTPAGTYNKTFTLTATTNPVNYVLTYNANSADSSIQNIPAAQSGSIATTSIKLSNDTPTRSHYTFGGWCTVVPTVVGADDSCMGEGAAVFDPGDDFGINQTTTNTTTLYAMWNTERYICTKEYRLQNADGTYPDAYTQDSTEEVTTGGTCTFTKTITDYQGNTGNDTTRSQSTQNILADTTIQMDFPRNTYALTINKNNTYISTVNGAGSYRWGEEVSISATLSQGEFAGWSQTAGDTSTFTNATLVTTTFTMPKSAATIYADGDIKVRKAGYITYHPNVSNPSDIQGEMGDQAASNSVSVILYASNYKRSGYGFAGWNTAADGTGTNYGPNETISTPSNVETTGLMLYAVWVQSAGNLQGWNGCDNMNEGDVTALTDTRDNDTYAIAKLADGKCWTIENLRLADKDSNNNDINLSNSNTNNPSLPLTNIYDATNPTTSNHLSPTTDPYQTAWCKTNSDACDDQSMLATNNTTLFTNNTSSSYSTSSNVYSYGNYYNWYSATAGNGKYDSGSNVNVAGDLCPNGWHLPTGKNASGDFGVLDIALGGSGAASSSSTDPTGATMSLAYRTYPNNFIYSGYVNGSSVSSRSSDGDYWSSTASGSNNAYNLYFYSSSVYPGTTNNNKYGGRTVRCVANS